MPQNAAKELLTAAKPIIRKWQQDPAWPIPVNTVAPVISGSLTTGSTLTCTQGTWTNSPTSFAYQWLRAGAAIAGATAATYVLVAADSGKAISCRVTASTPGASASAVSNTLNATLLSVEQEHDEPAEREERDTVPRGHRPTTGKR